VEWYTRFVYLSTKYSTFELRHCCNLRVKVICVLNIKKIPIKVKTKFVRVFLGSLLIHIVVLNADSAEASSIA